MRIIITVASANVRTLKTTGHRREVKCNGIIHFSNCCRCCGYGTGTLRKKQVCFRFYLYNWRRVVSAGVQFSVGLESVIFVDSVAIDG